ncbi:hypothetical protein OS493_027270 [Desmophyllum pertusum]|uniref:Uncharacterized protein n=1 Tax=Desmophyllum pertusum TaxID=174260 RepID=A0A9W9ZBW5_9CNID|nr:hypothetical protein OS493_027270 [Desmophyllum pertusum]
MADASSSGEEIEENPIETAISRGASLSEPAKASISRKRKIIVNDGKYKASREHKNLNSKTSVWDRIQDHPGQHLECVRGQLKCNACHEILAQKSSVDRHEVEEASGWNCKNHCRQKRESDHFPVLAEARQARKCKWYYIAGQPDTLSF